MNKIIIIVFLMVTMIGCKPKASGDKELETRVDSLAQEIEKPDFSNSQVFIHPETGDTLYVDFIMDSDNLESKKEYEKYYIVSTYSSYKNDARFEEELARWRKIEPDCYVEEFRIGPGVKYFISLGKFTTQDQVVLAFNEFKAKYPQENINYQLISQ
ncbi:hypothetical protein JEZ13_07205 [bacterium]|nr:hypothetical protein [bacterium]